MNMNGKILFYNTSDGRGIIITAKKEKLFFEVEEWDDFDIMPSLGLEVSFELNDGIPLSIVALSNAPVENEEPQAQTIESSEDEEENNDNNIEETVKNEEPINEEEAENDIEEDTQSDEDADSDEDEKEITTKHFENDEGISEIEDIEDEIGPREESVTVTLNLSKAVENYFNIIEENIERRSIYKKLDGKLDYLLVRRFLWTTFNNLSEIDLHIINPKIKAISDDLKEMASVYDDFVTKTKHPPLAYEEVFLSCQSEYVKIRDGAQKTIEKLNLLKGSEQVVGSQLKVKKSELDKDINTEEFDILKNELKSLNGAYVDTVHMMAELDERYKHDMELLKEFEAEYRSDFYELFNTAAKKYRKSLVDILSSQAYLLDTELWNQAKLSKAVKAHFHKASIVGEFNTKTYLKYYLDSFESENMNDGTKKLFNLYQYLCSLEKDYVMVVSSSAQDVMEYEASIKFVDKGIEVKSFINEKAALKWAMRNSIKVLVLEDELARIKASTFLKYYRKYVLVNPKIIILGEKPKSNEYAITKILSKNTSPRVVANNVKELIDIK